ncbi:hypothetical protein AX15_005723 [Amanita polypyramis BW_CC]|nr:hypothetical protein AX15_005723 [Amanita polypyramis BW_CC]
MLYTFRKQPVKGIYPAYGLFTTLFIHLPWWTLRSLRRSWSLGVAAKIGSADAASVAPIRIPGYWMRKNGSDLKVASLPVPGEKLVYHFHGGGYTRLSAHPSAVTANISRELLKHADQVHRTFSIEYRLSSTTPFHVANPFSAALIDALAGYDYLVNAVRFSPIDIIVVGDSAGGNLAHALTRYLVENQKFSTVGIPAPPAGLVLVSPWCDMSDSQDVLAAAHADSDYIVLGLAKVPT